MIKIESEIAINRSSDVIGRSVKRQQNTTARVKQTNDLSEALYSYLEAWAMKKWHDNRFFEAVAYTDA